MTVHFCHFSLAFCDTLWLSFVWGERETEKPILFDTDGGDDDDDVLGDENVCVHVVVLEGRWYARSPRATTRIGIDPQRGKCCSFQRIAREKRLSRERQVCPERRRQAKGRPPLDRVVQRQTRGQNHRRAKSRRPQKSASKDQRRLGDEQQQRQLRRRRREKDDRT